MQARASRDPSSPLPHCNVLQLHLAPARLLPRPEGEGGRGEVLAEKTIATFTVSKAKVFAALKV